VAPVRKKLGVPTIFNILGPLANPARAEFQLLGVGKSRLQPLMAEALPLLGVRRAVVVHGDDGLDEVTLAGTTQVIEASGGATQRLTWSPADFGLPQAELAEMRVSGPEESAGMIRAIFSGRRGPPRDIVIANAAAALWTVGRVGSLKAGAAQAAEMLDSGAALELLSRLAKRSHE
jgi:anthranilate phosphoribosyltransferase